MWPAAANASQGHRLLIFVTTSKASVLRMLEVDMDFAKKVAVPAVSNSQQLAAVLQGSRVFNSSEIRAAVGTVEERTGSDSVGVGIKTVLDCIFEAKAGAPDSDVGETFSDLLVEEIQERGG